MFVFGVFFGDGGFEVDGAAGGVFDEIGGFFGAGVGGEGFEGGAQVLIFSGDGHEIKEGPLRADGQGVVDFLEAGAGQGFTGEDGIRQLGSEALPDPCTGESGRGFG